MATAAECAVEVGAALASANLILIAVHPDSSRPPTWWGDAATDQQATNAESHVLVVLLAVEGEPGPAPTAWWEELVQPSLARRCAMVFEWDHVAGEKSTNPPVHVGDGLAGGASDETKFPGAAEGT